MTAPSLAPLFAPRGVAVIGASRDPAKVGGSVLANLRSGGFGGIYVVILKDTAARLAPFGPDEATEMIGELRMAPALQGARGRPAANLAALAETISRFSRLVAAAPELAELEVNPLMVGPHDVIAVDARATLACPEGRLA